MRHLVVFFVLLLTKTCAFSQTRLQEIDRIAISFKSDKKISLERLTVVLTKDLKTDYEKTRVIYRWITNNIAYDCKLYHKSKNTGKSLKFKKKTSIYRVYRQKKSVCGGYAGLMKYMCDIAGIKCHIVTGIAKGHDDIIGNMKLEQHAWNAIKLDGKWFMCDPTWGSGYTDPKVTEFTKSFDEEYFLIESKYFILSHYPDDPSWKLTDSKLNSHEFVNLPIVASGFYKNRINNFYPKKGVVRAMVGDTIEFIVSSNLEKGLKHISFLLVSNELEEITGKGNAFNRELRYTDLGYKCNYVIYRDGRYKVILYINGHHTLLYDFYVKTAENSPK